MVTRSGWRQTRANTMPLLLAGLLAVVAMVGTTAAGAAPRTSVRSAAATGPLFSESNREYTTMVTTRYQHHNQESEADHT